MQHAEPGAPEFALETEDGERIRALREEMASEAAERFLKSMYALGFSAGDAIELIKREEEHAHAGK